MGVVLILDCKGGPKWVFVETKPTAAILCFWAKVTTQNRVYDPGKSFHVSRIAQSIYFKRTLMQGQSENVGGSIVRPLIKNVYRKRGKNNCYMLSVAVNFNRSSGYYY